jgi:hypothetical protein
MSEMNTQSLDCFEIGGENLYGSSSDDPTPQKYGAYEVAIRGLEDIRVRVGMLLKTETVSFLLGAGASKDCGGPLIGTLPLEIEGDLLRVGITSSPNPRIRRWLKVFYLAVRHAGGQRYHSDHARRDPRSPRQAE